MAAVPTTECYQLDCRLTTLDREAFESGAVDRLREGFATPSGEIFWFRFLSKITPDAIALAAKCTADRLGFCIDPDRLPVYVTLYALAESWSRGEYLPWASKRTINAALKGCEFSLVGCSEIRNRKTLQDIIVGLGMDKRRASMLASPQFLRQHFPGYVDLLVRANNEIARICGNVRDVTTTMEVEMIRAHDFSESAMQKIAESPIAVTYLAGLTNDS